MAAFTGNGGLCDCVHGGAPFALLAGISRGRRTAIDPAGGVALDRDIAAVVCAKISSWARRRNVIVMAGGGGRNCAFTADHIVFAGLEMGYRLEERAVAGSGDHVDSLFDRVVLTDGRPHLIFCA